MGVVLIVWLGMVMAPANGRGGSGERGSLGGAKQQFLTGATAPPPGATSTCDHKQSDLSKLGSESQATTDGLWSYRRCELVARCKLQAFDSVEPYSGVVEDVPVTTSSHSQKIQRRSRDHKEQLSACVLTLSRQETA